MNFLIDPRILVVTFFLFCLAGSEKVAAAPKVHAMNSELASPLASPNGPLFKDRAEQGGPAYSPDRDAAHEPINPTLPKAEDPRLANDTATNGSQSHRLPVGRLSWREVTNWQELHRASLRK